MADHRIYRILFFQQGQVYELYARQVSQGGLYGFVEVEGVLFGERSKVVIDPSEERLRNELDGVKRFYVPMHAVVRIDEVEREGPARITEPAGGKVTPFPMPFYNPRGGGPEKP